MSEPQTWAAKDAPTADPYEHAVLTSLASAGDHDDGANCGISYATLAGRAKMSAQEAKQCIYQLRDRRLIGYGDQRSVEHIRGDRRPKVYDLLIPYHWYSPQQLERVNAWRVERGRPPLSPEPCGPECQQTEESMSPRCGHRPPLPDPPAKKRRSDAGTKRPRIHGGTTSTPVNANDSHGGTGSTPVVEPISDTTGVLVNSHGCTDKSVDEHLSSQVTELPDVHGCTGSTPTSFDLQDLPSLSLSAAADEPSTAGAKLEEREKLTEDPTPKTGTAADIDELVEAALAKFPHWPRSDTRRVIKAELHDGRPFTLVAAAWPLFLAHPETHTPNRFKHPREWWKAAYGVTPVRREPCTLGHPGGLEGSCTVCLSDAKGADGPTKVFVQAPKQRAPKPPWCGKCSDPTIRMVGLDTDNPGPCPVCKPRVTADAS